MNALSSSKASCYRIQVRGVLDPTWSAHFDGLVLTNCAGVTTMSGPIVDQSALHGLLARIRDLGLPLLLVERVENCQ